MTDHEPVETAWHIHAALADWTGKVDAKASFALTIESAVLAGIVALSGDGHRLSGLSGFWTHAFYWSGVLLLVSAVVLSASTVAPGLRHKSLKAEQPHNFIYFGHIKDWKEDDLTEALRQREILPVLSRQLVVMSRIAWKKHQTVLFSFLLACSGATAVAIAAALA